MWRKLPSVSPVVKICFELHRQTGQSENPRRHPATGRANCEATILHSPSHFRSTSR
jgi:hypothetical protein